MPWFGSKRTVAAEIWQRLGNVENFVEPFFGSGATLLARPHAAKTETVNDADHFLVNFWRAVKDDPDQVAHFADYIVSEADLQGRHYWLITEGRERIARCAGDPDYYDPNVAGWWLWGACAWIGSGWCSGEGPWAWDGEDWRGINRKLPHFGDAGQGSFILDWMQNLAARLRHVRVACGDWSRVCGDSVTWRHGMTGVFLDPPYGVEDRATVYSQDDRDVASKARDWAIAAGRRADMRIALASYDSDVAPPEGWAVYRWKAQGGYGSQGQADGRINAGRETIWFSPACLPPTQADLFAPARVFEATAP